MLVTSEYLISTLEELQEIPDCQDQGQNTFRLVQDIDATTLESPINDSTSPIAFSGVLNGGGHAITGISISKTAANAMGLFSKVHNAEFRNLTVSGRVATISPAVAARSSIIYLGALAGVASGAITVSSVTSNVEILLNAYNSNTGSGNSAYMRLASAGGLFGELNNLGSQSAQFSNTRILGGITSSRYVGGIAGRITTSGTAEFKANSVSVLSPSIASYALGGMSEISRAGGLIGEVSGAVSIEVKNSETRARLDGFGAGGFFAQLPSSANLKIEDSGNYGRVSGNSGPAGGAVGDSLCPVSIAGFINEGQVSHTTSFWFAGGLFGRVRSATISNSVNTGQISSVNFAGGLIGQALGSVSIESSTNSGDVSASNNSAGGFVGELQWPSQIRHSINTGQIVGKNNVGGLVGSSSALMIAQTINAGSVSGSVGYSGGLVGFASKTVTVNRVLNSAPVQGPNYVGGLVGFLVNQPGVSLEALDSANTGTVSANSNAAGFVGLGSSTHQITNSLQVGNVVISNSPGSSDAISLGDPGPVLVSVFTNKGPSAWIGTSTDEALRNRATFVGWDFDNVWGFLNCDTSNGFPVLRFAYSGEIFNTAGCVSGSAGGGQSSAGTGGNDPTPQVEAPRYTGPMLESLTTPITQGTSATFAGTKLDRVESVLILGAAVTVSAVTATSLTILVPATLVPGAYDLELRSSYGRLTVLSALTVGAAEVIVQPDSPAATKSPATVVAWRWMPAFTKNSRAVNDRLLAAIQSAVSVEARTVVCWGYTAAAAPSEWALNHARARASAVCKTLAALRPDLKVVISIKAGSPKFHAMRASLQFWK
jgi:hypothetical protein